MQFFKGGTGYAQGQTPYEIFQDRMTAITSMVTNVKNAILEKYHKGLFETYLSTVNKEINEDQQKEITNLFSTDPEDIYGDIEATVTQFVDQEMSMMMKKEIMMGHLPSVAPKAETSEVMIPKNDSQEFLNAIQSLPQNKRDWSSVTAYMKENRPRFMGSSSPMETQIIGQILGEQISQRDQYMKDIQDAKIIKDFFAKGSKERTWNEFIEEANQFVQNNPGYEITATNPATGSVTISKKDVKPEINWEEVNKQIEEYGLQLTGMNINPITKNVSYSFGARETGMTWEETITKTNQFMQDNPDYEVTSTNPKTGSVTISKKGEPEGGLKDLTSSDINTYNKLFYGDDNSFGAITPEEYAEAVDSWERMNKNKLAPEHLDILEKALQECLDMENKIIDDEWFGIYEWIYSHYENVLKGQSPKYLPPGEIKKVGTIEGALTFGGVKKGDYGSALVVDQEGKAKDDKGYIVGETYRDEEGKLWKYIGNGKFEEVEEKTGEKSRKRQ